MKKVLLYTTFLILLVLLFHNIRKNTIEKFNNKYNVIMTTYFFNNKDPQRNKTAPGNDIKYIKSWYESIKKLGLNGIVFHDGLSNDFIKKYQTNKIKFEYVNPKSFKYSLNDQRFVIYLDYLKKHPEIEKVFMTDGNDVKVVQDPFKYIKKAKYYVGSEEKTIGNSKWILHKFKILNKSNKYNSYFKENRLLNAGILGGGCDNIIKMLHKMRDIFNDYDESMLKSNLNMVVFNYVLYKYFPNNIVTRPPIHSLFKKYENNRKDVWFIHK
tara:strand:+ start:8407 stop:9213 length:807 start_codon:yes stop_codon:yes gene_type:complete